MERQREGGGGPGREIKRRRYREKRDVESGERDTERERES